MSSNAFRIHQYALGPWDNLMYLLEDLATKECAVIDPAWDVEVIREQIVSKELKPTHCLITHNHYDHVNMIEPLQHYYPGLPVYMSETEIEWSDYKNPTLQSMKHGDKIKIGHELNVAIIKTPGHSPGSVSFHVGNNLLTGDAVFIDSCGRADFEGGDPRTLYETVNRLAENLDDSTRIYPGHGSLERGSDTLAGQKKTNPYFVFDNYEDFETKRMDGYAPGSPLPTVSPEWKEKVASIRQELASN